MQLIAHDPDQGDEIINYQWNQIDSSGFNVQLSDPSSPITSFIAPSKVPHSIAAGTNLPLKFGLTVTDNHGESSSDQVTVPVQCSEADIEDANSMRSELNNIMSIVWKPAGFIHSVDALKQWLSGMGGTVDLTNWLKTEKTVSSSAAINLQRFQQLTENTGPNAGQKLADVIRNVDKDGKTRTYLAKWDVDHKETLLTDVGNTLGSFKLRSEGEFTIQQIDKKSIQVSGQVTHRIIDDYNFNPDSPFNKYNILKKCNGAEDFINIAQWKHIVNSLQKPNMILKDLKDGTLPFVLEP